MFAFKKKKVYVLCESSALKVFLIRFDLKLKLTLDPGKMYSFIFKVKGVWRE